MADAGTPWLSDDSIHSQLAQGTLCAQIINRKRSWIEYKSDWSDLRTPHSTLAIIQAAS